jgi:hypothetical protein
MSLRNLFFSAVLLLSFQQLSFAGDTVSDDRKISKFTVLKITGNFKVVLIPDAEYALKVNGNKNTVSAVQSKMAGIILNISVADGTKDSATLYISFKEINQITINGSCNVSCTKQIKSDDMKLDLEGTARGSMDLKIKMLTFIGNTDGNFTLTGKVDKSMATVKGDGALDLSQLKVEDLTLDFGTDTDIKIYAKPTLNITMGGAGNVMLYGHPKNNISHIHGTGELKLAD